jgi:hypothetical protein
MSAKHEDIVKAFLASKTFDFGAFGKFVAENGANIASSQGGEFGFVIGVRFIRYCIPPALRTVVEGVDPVEAGVRTQVTGA